MSKSSRRRAQLAQRPAAVSESAEEARAGNGRFVAGNTAAVTHGATAAAEVLPGESPSEFRTFRGAWLAELQPVGIVEEYLAARVVTAAWRLLRIARIEVLEDAAGELPAVRARVRGLAPPVDAASTRTRLIWSRADGTPYDAVTGADLTGAEVATVRGRARPGSTPAATRGYDWMAKLGRYEGSMERSFSRALNALEARQEERRHAAGADSVPMGFAEPTR